MRAVGLPLAVLLVAGCAAPAGPPAGAGPWLGSWNALECTAVLVAIPVDADRLQAVLPEGFTPAASPLLPLGLGPGQAEFHLDAYDCAEDQGDFPMYGSFYAPVEPPEERRAEAPDLAGHFVKWDTLVPEDAERAPFAAVGLPVHGGQAEVTLDALTGQVQARLHMAGAGGFALQGLAPGPEGGEATFSYVEFTPLANGTTGLATWWAHARATGRSGAGQVDLEPGTWVADVIGASSAQAQFFAAAWSIESGNVTAPS